MNALKLLVIIFTVFSFAFAEASSCNRSMSLFAKLKAARVVSDPELVIDKSYFRQALIRFRERQEIPLITSFETYRPLLIHVPPIEALSSAAVIKKNILAAASLVKDGQVLQAARLLDNPHLLDKTGFLLQNEMSRQFIRVDLINGLAERGFARNLVQSLTKKPAIEPNGIITLPHRPLTNDVVEYQKVLWANREWVRLAAEEFGHVVQLLLQHAGYEGLLSEMMKQNEVLRKQILEQGWNYNRSQFVGMPSNMVDWQAETDIYAFLIETFGPEFIPRWVGRNSDYFLRENIDGVFHLQGLPNRRW